VNQRGAISYTFADEEPTQQSRVDVTVYTLESGDLEALVPLSPDDPAYALPTYPRKGNLYWDHDSVDGQDMGADATPEQDGGVKDAQAMMSGDDADNDDSVTYGDLSDSGQSFVDSAVEGVNAKDYDAITDFDDWDERWEMATAGEDPDITIEQSEAEAIINERV